MNQVNIGTVIKNYRVNKGFSQEDICMEEISVSTISNIETGKVVPSTEVVKLLFAKMGLNLPLNISTAISEEQYQRYMYQEIITEKWKNEEEEDDELLEKFRNINLKMDVFDWQFYYFHKGLLLKQQGKSDKKTLHKLREFFFDAIRFTLPDFSVEWDFSDKKIITPVELNCIIELAETDQFIHKTECSDSLIQNLAKYLDKGYVNSKQKEELLLRIEKYFLLRSLYSNNFEKILLHSTQGIEKSLKYQNLQFLIFFIDEKAKCLSKIGKDSDSNHYRYLHESIVEEFRSKEDSYVNDSRQ